MKVSTKIVLGFGVVMTLLVVAAGTYHFALQQTLSSYDNVLSHEEVAKTHYMKLGQAMLEARRSEKDFLLRLDAQYPSKVRACVAQMQEHIDALKALATKTGDVAEGQAAEQMGANAAVYLKAFDGLVAAWERRGLDEKSGLQGTFRDIVHKLESALRACDVASLHIALLQMRRCEKDFALRREQTYIDQMSTRVADFRRDLDASNLADESKAELRTRADAYEKSFATFAQGVLDNKEQDESAAGFREAAHAMEKSLADRYIPDVMVNLLMLRRHEKDYLLRLDAKYVEQANKTIQKLTSDIAGSGLPEASKTTLTAGVAAYRDAFQALVTADGEIAKTAEAMREAVHNLEPVIAAAVESAGEAMETEAATTSARAERWAMLALCAGGLALLAGTIAAWLITRSVTKPIYRAVTELNDGANQVHDAARQVAGSSQQLAQSSGEQASSLEETSSALEQMAAMTRTNAENAKKANELAGLARSNANQGDQTMQQLNTAMDAINEASGKIGKVIKVIEEIAFQTNLLALNAAVEAARAGEQGKGFAVVAEEVRNLAMRAGGAARETTGLIQGSMERAREGTDVANAAADALRGIVGNVAEVADLLGGISQASDEQARGVEQVNTAVAQMDKLTQQNAASAEESAAASEELSAQSEAVRGAVDRLAAMVTGKHAEAIGQTTPNAAR